MMNTFDFTALQKHVRERQEHLLYVCTVPIEPCCSLFAYHQAEVSRWLLTWGYHKLILLERDETGEGEAVDTLSVYSCLALDKAGNPDYLPNDTTVKPGPTVDNTVFVAMPRDIPVSFLDEARRVSEAMRDTLDLTIL